MEDSNDKDQHRGSAPSRILTLLTKCQLTGRQLYCKDRIGERKKEGLFERGHWTTKTPRCRWKPELRWTKRRSVGSGKDMTHSDTVRAAAAAVILVLLLWQWLMLPFFQPLHHLFLMVTSVQEVDAFLSTFIGTDSERQLSTFHWLWMDSIVLLISMLWWHKPPAILFNATFYSDWLTLKSSIRLSTQTTETDAIIADLNVIRVHASFCIKSRISKCIFKFEKRNMKYMQWKNILFQFISCIVCVCYLQTRFYDMINIADQDT